MRITPWKLLKQSAFWLLVAVLLLILLFPFYYAVVLVQKRAIDFRGRCAADGVPLG